MELNHNTLRQAALNFMAEHPDCFPLPPNRCHPLFVSPAPGVTRSVQEYLTERLTEDRYSRNLYLFAPDGAGKSTALSCFLRSISAGDGPTPLYLSLSAFTQEEVDATGAPLTVLQNLLARQYFGSDEHHAVHRINLLLQSKIQTMPKYILWMDDLHRVKRNAYNSALAAIRRFQQGYPDVWLIVTGRTAKPEIPEYLREIDTPLPDIGLPCRTRLLPLRDAVTPLLLEGCCLSPEERRALEREDHPLRLPLFLEVYIRQNRHTFLNEFRSAIPASPAEILKSGPLPPMVHPAIRDLQECLHISTVMAQAIRENRPGLLHALDLPWPTKLGPVWGALAAAELCCTMETLVEKLYDCITASFGASRLRHIPRNILEAFPYAFCHTRPWAWLGTIMGDRSVAWSYEPQIWLNERDPMPLDKDCRIHLCRELAQGGDSRLQFQLGRVFDMGIGVEKNDEEALRWFESAAANNFPWAEYHMANKYAQGLGEAQPALPRAVHHWRHAARSGVSHAAFRLIRYLNRADAAEQEREEAALWCQYVEEQWGAAALFRLGKMFYLGDGVSQDRQRAEALFLKAARSDPAQKAVSCAQLMLFRIYEEQKPQKASCYLEKARRGHFAAAQTELALLLHREGKPLEALRWFHSALLSPPDGEDTADLSFFLGSEAVELRKEAEKAMAEILCALAERT